MIRRDPLKRELKSLRRGAWVDIQRGRGNEDDEANQRYHLADMGLKALRRGRKNSGGAR